MMLLFTWCAAIIFVLMSKSKQKPTSSPEEAQGNKRREVFAALADISAANKKKWAKLNKPVKMIIGLLLWLGLEHAMKQPGLSVAALYMFANDGVISGRQSGSVKMRNGRERRFVVPSLIRNAYTAAARYTLSVLSSGWATLTDVQRNSWLTVENVFKSDRFGRAFKLSGKALFIERNANLLQTGIAVIDTYAPSEGVLGSILTDGTATTTAGLITTMNVVYAATPTDTSVEHKLFATAPLPAGVSKPKQSAYRLITVIPNGTATPFDCLAAYTAKYGNVATIGQKIGFQLSPVNNKTGELSGISQFIVVVN